MYKNFFGLRENPFNTNPDPRFLYVTPQVQQAREQLIYGVQNRKGLILLTGEVGTGKTTLVNSLLDWLHQQKMPTAFIFNPRLSVDHLFDFILTDFGIPTDSKLKSNMLLLLNQWLLERFRAGSTPVLIVDEAQGLSFELLEEIRLLLNLETASEKLLQVVLVGQPELEDKLKHQKMRQLRQRVALRCKTAPLTLEESRAYIADRLRIAGATGDPVFESDAVEAVHFYSRGIPRVINLLCEHSLINSYVDLVSPVPALMVEEAAREFWMDEIRPVAKHASLWNQNNENSEKSQSICINEPAYPMKLTEGDLPESDQIAWPPATGAFLSDTPELVKTEIPSTNELQSMAVMATSGGDLDLSLGLDDLSISSPTPESRQNKTETGWESEQSREEAVAQFVAELKRNLEAGSLNPKLQLMSRSAGNEPSAGVNRTQAKASNKRALSLESMNRLPSSPSPTRDRGLLAVLGEWRNHWDSVTNISLFLTTLAGVSAEAIAKLRKSICVYQVLLRLWRFELQRDWAAMVNAIASSQMNRALLRWLRQPVSSKAKNSI